MVVAVAVAATLCTAGALAEAIGGILNTLQLGARALSGGAAGGSVGATLAGISASTAVGLGLAASAVGSIASHVLGYAISASGGFSWASVALAGSSARNSPTHPKPPKRTVQIKPVFN